MLHEGLAIALGDPPDRVREQEFQTHGVPGAELLRRLDAVLDYARGANAPGPSYTATSKSKAASRVTDTAAVGTEGHIQSL